MYWKKWAAKHEYEELKEGIWLEPTCLLGQEDEGGVDGQASQRRKEVRLGRRMGASRLFDIGWSNENTCQGCYKEEATV